MENENNENKKGNSGEEEIDYSADDFKIQTENIGIPMNVDSPYYQCAKKTMEDMIASGEPNPILDMAMEITRGIYLESCNAKIKELELKLKDESLSKYDIAIAKWEIQDKKDFIEHLSKSRTIQEVMSFQSKDKPSKEDYE